MKTTNYSYRMHHRLASVIACITMLLILSVPFRVFSQETVVYSEGFEANNGGYYKIIEPPDPEFPALTGDGLWEWGVPSWISANSGSKCWGTNFAGYMPQGTSSIMSPPISLAALNPATQSARVTFWAQTDISMSGARGSFLVSTDGSNFTRLANFFIEMAGGWNRYEFDISNYIGGNIYLKFFIVDEGNDHGFYVDDISIFALTKTAHTRTLTLEANESSEGSCPWIYTWDGSKYNANNDIYSTARYAGGEYRDYLALAKPLVAENGKYKLQINEAASDESFTDYLQLKTVDHAANVKVAPDNFGNIFAYRPANLFPPVTAVSNLGINVLNAVSSDDGQGFNAYSQDYVDVDFGNVDISSGGRLVLKMQGFRKGTGTPKPFVGPPAVVVQSLIGGVWTEVGRMFPRFEWDVCAFDVSSFGIAPGAPVKIRLFSISHDLKYSNIDYVAMETGPEPAKTVSIAPLTGATYSSSSVFDKLNVADNLYANLKPGNHMNLEFAVPGQAASTRSFVFVSEGYYIPRGSTYFVATWNGTKWVIHDAYSFSTIDETKTFDLSMYLPDPDNEMKVRIWQDYAEGTSYPAYIDYVGMQQDGTVGTLEEAWDLVNKDADDNFISIIPETFASDNITFSLGDQVYERRRWTGYKWSGITNSGLPVVSDMEVIPATGTIKWKYTDPEGDEQLETCLQVWTGPDGTGSLYWGPPPFPGTDTAVIYGGIPMVNGVTYHCRIRVQDHNSGKSAAGNNWSQWAEQTFVYNELSVPGVYTTAPTAITTSGATSGGEIFNDGGVSVSVSGVCWSTTTNPTISDAHSTDGNAIGIYTSSITGLSGALGVTYYVRAYATNSVGTGYGPELSFTYGLPSVTTYSVSSITATDAISGGNVLSDGSSTVTVRGVCWNTTGTPTISDDFTSDGPLNGSMIGAFTSSITGLTNGTFYHVRAYATNAYGTNYGGEMIFGFNEGTLVVDAGFDASIAANENYSLSGSATGGSMYPVTSFEWTTGGDGTFSPDATSTYSPSYTPGSTDISTGYVYITLTANCADPVTPTLSDEMQLTIEAPSLSAAASVVSNVSCYGLSDGSVTVSVTGEGPTYDYVWSTDPAQTAETASGLSAGTYTVSVTFGAITVTSSAVVTQPLDPLSAGAWVVSHVSCNGGNNGSATVSVSGGTTPYYYAWPTSPVQSTATATGLTAGTYWVTVSDANGCSVTSSATLTQPVQWWPTVTGPTPVCQKSTGNVFTTNAGMTNYVWDVPAGGVITAGGTATDSTVTVTWTGFGPKAVKANYNRLDGCIAAVAGEKNVMVNPVPTTAITGDPTVTQAQVVKYETAYSPGFSYTWNASHGNPEICYPNRNCLTITWDFPCGVIGSGFVTVTETNMTTGCSTIATQLITITP